MIPLPPGTTRTAHLFPSRRSSHRSSKARNMAPSASELKMAKMLVQDMSGVWDPEEFQDEYRQTVMDLVEKKARAGKTKTVVEPQEERSEEHTTEIQSLTRNSYAAFYLTKKKSINDVQTHKQ